MRRLTFASAAAPGRDSDDLFLDTEELIGVFDGVTKPHGVETGCIHGPAWFVDRLAYRIRELMGPPQDLSLVDLLAKAIDEVRGDHGSDCDPDNPSTPAASLCLLRTGGDRLDYLVLCDAVLLLETTDGIEVITDDRFPHAMADLPLEHEAREREKRKLTNQLHGYWIAAATPEAARHALTGSIPVSAARRVALLTDGASRAVDTFGLFDWRGLLDLVTEQGPDELIRQVRTAERQALAHPRHKRHDDATVALLLFDEERQ